MEYGQGWQCIYLDNQGVTGILPANFGGYTRPMKQDAATPTPRDLPTASVVKSDIADLLSPMAHVGIDGEHLWPIAPQALLALYKSSAEHGRAIQVKAESGFGGGLIGGGAATLEALCQGGAASLFTALEVDVGTYGNGFMQIVRGPGGNILELRRLPAITMHRYRDGYLQRAPLPGGRVRKITFTADEVIHLRDLCPGGGRYALPSWIGADGMLELTHAAMRHNAGFFSNAAIPEFAVIFKGTTPSQAEKDAIREFFRQQYQGIERTHRTLLLHLSEDADVKFEKLTADVKDGDFLKLLDAARDRMPVAHGVPPRMLGIMAGGQLGGGGEVEGQFFVFENLTLKPRRRRTLDQIAPVLRELSLVALPPDGSTPGNAVGFRPLDMPAPTTPAQAQPQSATEPPEMPVSRSGGTDPLDGLVALLGRI